jgi:nitrate/TMAO reductase-like tetraheme cytochrome c subunit
MKKIIVSSFIALSLLAACKSKKQTATTSGSIDSAQLTAAKTKYPNATEAEMKKGNEVYFGASCTRCHSAKTITEITADEWPSIIERMAKKAKISDEEKDAVLKYVTGVKLAAK